MTAPTEFHDQKFIVQKNVVSGAYRRAGGLERAGDCRLQAPVRDLRRQRRWRSARAGFAKKLLNFSEILLNFQIQQMCWQSHEKHKLRLQS